MSDGNIVSIPGPERTRQGYFVTTFVEFGVPHSVITAQDPKRSPAAAAYVERCRRSTASTLAKFYRGR